MLKQEDKRSIFNRNLCNGLIEACSFNYIIRLNLCVHGEDFMNAYNHRNPVIFFHCTREIVILIINIKPALTVAKNVIACDNCNIWYVNPFSNCILFLLWESMARLVAIALYWRSAPW